MADWKSYPTHETRGRRDDVPSGGEPCQSRGRLLEGFFGGWGRLPGAEAVERLKRLTGQERASVATALVRREQVPPAGAERRTSRVVPVEDRVVVQVRPSDDRRRGPDTYILHREELLRLLPPEEAPAVN